MAAGATLRAAPALAAALLGLGPGASAQWVIESSDGGSSIKLGFLAQPEAEWLEAPGGGQCAQNLFLRRFRVVFGGHVSERWSFFFETDSPNVGKANPDQTANPIGVKDAGSIDIQDAVLTYTQNAAFKVDAGFQLIRPTRTRCRRGSPGGGRATTAA